MIRRFLFLILPLYLFLSSAGFSTVNAHGAGPPFLLINGKVADTNPLYFGSTKVFTAQDLAPERYLVNQALEFKIDSSALAAGIVGVNVEELSYRWSFDEGSVDYSFERSPKHVYKETGTHFLTFEAKPTNEPDWVVLNTVQIDVVPSSNYQTPSARIATVGKNHQTEEPINFVAQTKSSIKKYFWDFGDETKDERVVTKTFKSDGEDVLPQPVFLRATDSNELVSDDMVYIRIVDGKILIEGSIHKGVPVVSEGEAKVKESNNFIPTAIGVGILLIAVVTIYFWRKRKRA